ncbi:hypothetical protein SAMD00019534_038200 [Acytostelium subglobosum LB1]|uniref:hypothetical protein n=1 Tax=Acytostelium subglobosum LB1 TaxID=1410327 RepID=UPI000644FD6D|nr:hypothetical protein SAMD00019534_038200 [Acytostelium subglobosum LB1]GAM20645.1 hypothetical protein SAMD00019534_038200 [Acytostelium subglobosum LB1]|eukprot:XP_012760166.1 hypothetical protein SAMD00019534_038200 [Acytostelium subglobosum LB1]
MSYLRAERKVHTDAATATAAQSDSLTNTSTSTSTDPLRIMEDRLQQELTRDGRERRPFDVRFEPESGDIIAFYNDRFNSVEMAIVSKVYPNGYLVLGFNDKFITSKSTLCVTIPTGNETTLQYIMKTINDKIADNKMLPFDVDRHVYKREILSDPLEWHSYQNHPLRVQFDNILHYFKELNVRTRKSWDVYNIQNTYRQPHSGVSFYDSRVWSRDQSHTDHIPIYSLINNQLATNKEASTNILQEIFYSLDVYRKISWNATSMIMTSRSDFCCLTEQRSRYLGSIINAMKHDSTDLWIVAKYLLGLVVDNGGMISVKGRELMADASVPTIMDHDQFIDKETGKQYVNHASLRMCFGYIQLGIKELAAYSREQNFGQMVYTKLGKMGINDKTIAALRTLLYPKLNVIEEKLRTHSNLIIQDPPFLLSDQKRVLSQITHQTRPLAKRITQLSLAIDDVKTKDVDDAIGIIQEGQDLYCVVHIADVSAFIEASSSMDSWGLLKTSSVYLPTQTHFMLPEDFSLKVGLAGGRTNHCMSFKFRITDDGELVDPDIFVSDIENMQRTTYKDVDNYFKSKGESKYTPDQQQMLDRLHHFARIRRQRRESEIKAGIILPKPEIEVNKDNGHISLKFQDPNSISQLIVSEMMISANNTAALFAKNNQLAIPFRMQKNSSIADYPWQCLDQYHPIALSSQLASLTPPADMSTEHSFHSSLGIDYTWASSPIRRYSDILVHRQIRSALAKQGPAYDRPALDKMVVNLDRNYKHLKRTSRANHNQWMLKYLRQEGSRYYSAVLLPDTIGKKSHRFLMIDLNMMVPSHDLDIDCIPINEIVQIYADVSSDGYTRFHHDPSVINQKRMKNYNAAITQ